MSQMIPTTHRLLTRASNKEKHPGLLDAKVRRRSHADVAEEQNLAEAADKNSRVKGKMAVSKVAGLEDRMQTAYTSSMVNAANPSLSAIKKVTKRTAAVASSAVVDEAISNATRRGSGELASTSTTPQAVPNDAPKRKRPTVRSEIMSKRTAVVGQASKSNLKRKAEEVEHDRSKSMASLNAQRTMQSHQPRAPSGLVPGFQTGKRKVASFKLPPAKSRLLSAPSVSTPSSKQMYIATHDTMGIDRHEGHAANQDRTDAVYSNTFARVADFGGLEDEDEHREGASVPRTMARRRGKQSSGIVSYEAPVLRITHGHGVNTQASQGDSAYRNTPLAARDHNDSDSEEELTGKVLHHRERAGIRLHHNLPMADQPPEPSQPRNWQLKDDGLPVPTQPRNWQLKDDGLPVPTQPRNWQLKGERSAGFSTDDLPAGTQARWRRVFVPAWRDFVGTLENPWNLSNPVADIQRLWDVTFPSVPHIVAHSEAVFSLAMQRIYEWRNGFTIAALQAVQAFWDGDPAYSTLDGKNGDGGFWSGDPIFQDSDERAEYAAWAVSPEKNIPFLWRSVDDTDPQDVKCKGAFESPWVCRILAYHLSATANLDEEYRHNERPIGALSLAAAAGEREFKMWLSGNRIKHHKRGNSSFSEDNWGDSTTEYSSSIQQLHPPGWKRILARASKYKQSRKGQAMIKAVEGAAITPSARSSIVDKIQNDGSSGNEEDLYYGGRESGEVEGDDDEIGAGDAIDAIDATGETDAIDAIDAIDATDDTDAIDETDAIDKIGNDIDMYDDGDDIDKMRDDTDEIQDSVDVDEINEIDERDEGETADVDDVEFLDTRGV